MDKFVCPIINTRDKLTITYCLQNKCAWWYEEKQKCALLYLAQTKEKK